jgi:uncharacterized protein YybS (DUF2232 family)
MVVSGIGQNQLSKDVFWGITLTACLTAAALYLPIGFMIGFLIPLPLIFYRIKLGRLFSGVILCTVLAIVWIIFGKEGAQSEVFFLYFGLTGVILAEAFAQNLSVEKTVLMTVGVVLGAGAILLFAYTLFAPESLGVLTKTYLRENIDLAIALYKDMGVSLEKIEILQNSLESILYIFIHIIPGLFVAFTLFTVWVNLLMTRSILKKRNLFCPDFGSLNRWKSPEHLVWIAIGSGVLLLLPVSGLKILGLNGLIVLIVVYMFQGLAIISYYFEKKRFPLLLRGFVYTLVAVQQFLVIAVILAGFLDVWADFRRLKAQR